MSKRMQEWAEKQCEKIAEVNPPGSRCEVLQVRGPDVLYRLSTPDGTWEGWEHEGESHRDIRWELA